MKRRCCYAILAIMASFGKKKKKECEYLRHIKNKQYKQVYMPRTATKISGT